MGDAVGGTLGPRGRRVAVQKRHGAPVISRTGAVVAEAVAEELAAAGRLDAGGRVVADAATASKKAGDGTATAAVLARAIYRERARLVAEGHGARDVDAGLRQGARAVMDDVSRAARAVTDAGAPEIAAVARTSAGADAELGEVLAEAAVAVGSSGAVLIDVMERAGTTWELFAGTQFDSHRVSGFAADPAAMTCTLKDCRVLLVGTKLPGWGALLPLIGPLDDARRSPLLVVDTGVNVFNVRGMALRALVDKHKEGVIRCAVVNRIARSGASVEELMADLAVLTGGRVIDDFAAATPSDLGHIAEVFIQESSTAMIGTAGDRGALEARAAELHAAADPSMSTQRQAWLRWRLARLAHGIARVHVGPGVDAEAPERRQLAERALRAARAAIASGVVAGGGVALLRARAALDRLGATGDHALGVDIVRRALEAPLRRIAENAGEDGARIVREVERGGGAFGYDATTRRFADLHALGILDPASVVCSALENAFRAVELPTLLPIAAAMADSRPSSDPGASAPGRSASDDDGDRPGGLDDDDDTVFASPEPRPRSVEKQPLPLSFRGSPPASSRVPERWSRRSATHIPHLERAEPESLLVEDEGTSITRHPSIQPDGMLRAGAPVVLTIDLLRAADQETSTDGVRIKGLPRDWTALPVRVHVDASHVTFDAGCDQGIVVVRRNAGSRPCTVMGVVAPGAREIEVLATFFHDGRYVGEARRILAVEAGISGEPPQASPAARPDDAPCGVVVIDPWVPAPDMTVRIFHRSRDPKGLFGWYIEVPSPAQIAGLPADRLGEMQIEGDPERWALKLFERFANDAQGVHTARLEGMGEALYKAAPACFHEAYRALHAHHGGRFSIQFVCDDPFIPWEFMRPLRADGTALPLLLMNHPVARWIPGRPRRSTIDRGEVVTIVPTYRHRELEALPAAALDQASIFTRRLAARPVAARKDDVLALLEDQEGARVALLYFAGHGEVDDDLDDALLHLDDDDLEPYEVRRAETMLGRHAGTFVFLNACRVGRQGRALGSPGSWPGAFLDRDFGGYLAPISRVWERDAARFAEEFIDRCFHRKMTIGEALWELRKNLSSPAALAYVYYGDVMTRFAGVSQEVSR
ncbi:TCP-1/cpn60 chaperonin family protein [Sorangium sp. So ce118]